MRALVAAAAAFLLGGPAQAHHSYAMFDSAATRKVSGSVARLEWKNPHVFLWVYVPNEKVPHSYDLWAFENGSPSVLSVKGWSAEVLKSGDKIMVEYWPLRTGGKGGHFEKGTLADGRVLVGAGGPGRF